MQKNTPVTQVNYICWNMLERQFLIGMVRPDHRPGCVIVSEYIALLCAIGFQIFPLEPAYQFLLPVFLSLLWGGPAGSCLSNQDDVWCEWSSLEGFNIFQHSSTMFMIRVILRTSLGWWSRHWCSYLGLTQPPGNYRHPVLDSCGKASGRYGKLWRGFPTSTTHYQLQRQDPKHPLFCASESGVGLID